MYLIAIILFRIKRGNFPARPLSDTKTFLPFFVSSYIYPLLEPDPSSTGERLCQIGAADYERMRFLAPPLPHRVNKNVTLFDTKGIIRNARRCNAGFYDLLSGIGETFFSYDGRKKCIARQ